MVLTAVALALLAFGGKKWWDVEDRDYQNNDLYRPLPVSAHVRTEHDQLILRINVDVAERRGRLVVGRTHLARLAPCLDHRVDRPIIKMKPVAVG